MASPPLLRQAQARRIALAAQGFARPRPAAGTVQARDLRRVLHTVGLVQIDSVNVLTRSHYLPFFSRLGSYDPTLLDQLRDRAPRAVVEYWAHEASLVPVELWSLFRFRMDRALTESWGWMQEAAHEHPDLLGRVREEVTCRGPVTATDLEARIAHDHDRSREDWGWNWSLVKRVLEHLFWAGEITSAGRNAAFQRRYAVPEKVLPPAVRARLGERVSEAEAFVALMELGARAHGVGTEQCFRDYARLRPEQARPALTALVDQGVLEEVRIEGWHRPAYLHRDARRPRAVRARALLSPFDSLIWTRDRTRAIFGFDYRLEIYVPEQRRVHGYYVLPFLLGDELIARVDLKAHRHRGELLARQITWEHGRGTDAERAELLAELDLMAQWLGLPGGVRTPSGRSPRPASPPSAPNEGPPRRSRPGPLQRPPFPMW